MIIDWKAKYNLNNFTSNCVICNNSLQIVNNLKDLKSLEIDSFFDYSFKVIYELSCPHCFYYCKFQSYSSSLDEFKTSNDYSLYTFSISINNSLFWLFDNEIIVRTGNKQSIKIKTELISFPFELNISNLNKIKNRVVLL